MLNKNRLVLIVLGLSLFGGGIWGVSKIAQQIYHKDYQLTGMLSNGHNPPMTEENIEKTAKYDFAFFTPGLYERQSYKDAIPEIQRLNLDFMVGSYIPVHSIGPWCKTAYEMGQTGYLAKLWENCSPHFAITTEGDTATIFRNAFLIDLFSAEARTALIETNAEYMREHKIDAAMLDFFSVPLPNLKVFQDPIWEELELGDLDFDRDGIGHWDDPDEKQELRRVWDLYMDEAREKYPQFTKLYPNGSLPLWDPLFSKYFDGCYIEGFPNWFFGTQAPNWPNVYDPEFPHSLWNLCNPDRWYSSDYYIFLEDTNFTRNFGYIAKVFPRAVELFNFRTREYPPEPLEIDTGAPLGGPVLSEDRTMITREFEKGTVIIRWPFTSRPVYSFDPTPVAE